MEGSSYLISYPHGHTVPYIHVHPPILDFSGRAEHQLHIHLEIALGQLRRRHRYHEVYSKRRDDQEAMHDSQSLGTAEAEVGVGS